MSSTLENFATGLVQGFSVHLQNDLDRRNKERALRLSAEIKAQQEQLDRNNIAQVFENHYAREYADVPPIDTTAESAIVPSRQLHDDVTRGIYGTTAELIRGGMSSDDALQFAREEYGNQLDQIDRMKNARMTQAYVHMANGDTEGALNAFLDGANYSMDGLAHVRSSQQGPDGSPMIDVYDEDSGELLGSVPFTPGMPEAYMLKASAVPEYFAKRKKEARDEGRAARRMAMDEEKFALRTAQEEQRNFGSNLDYLRSALVPVGDDFNEYAMMAPPEEQQQIQALDGLAQELAVAAATTGGGPEVVASMHEFLRDMRDRSIFTADPGSLRIGKRAADGGGYIGYKGKRFYAPTRVYDMARALKAQMVS